MSELKEHLFCDCNEMFLENGSPLSNDIRPYYIKSEADKVIEFWKSESHEHYERWFNLNKQYEGWFGKVCRCERAERELRKEKYKRCLAMALLWLERTENSTDLENELVSRRRCSKWMELAEKFKSNNEVNNA